MPEAKEQSSSSGADTFRVQAPQLSLPKGGGAIRGIGEKFAANPVRGTGSMSVPIALSPGRNGFSPQLSIAYDSGSGNGIFGLGWSLSLPSITRKTDKGLPSYNDDNEWDIFILSGAEDLVPELAPDGNGVWQTDGSRSTRMVDGRTYRIRRYRPRIEGLFARIERWSNVADARDTLWRSISKDNVTTWYGRSAQSRIADPADPTRIFSWLICESHDDKGNVIVYGYKPEDSRGVDIEKWNERNRSDLTRSANRYIKRIRYGNHRPYWPILAAEQPWPAPPGVSDTDASVNWHFELVFDYGEHDLAGAIPLTEVRPWSVRHDPSSSYRSRFEVRTYRRCSNVLMFHHFPDEPGVGAACLVRSTSLTYSDVPSDPLDPIYSFLLSVREGGYRRTATGYVYKSLPPVEFEYSQAVLDQTVRRVDSASLENLPSGLADSGYQWVDLDGEGSAGFLSEQGGAWFYKPNWSAANRITEEGSEVTLARFGPSRLVGTKPATASLVYGRQQLISLAGNGRLDIADYEGPAPGYFERTEDRGWEPYARFDTVPVLDWSNPDLRMIDLTGDGFPDLLISEEHAFVWHQSLAKAGFGVAHRVAQAFDEEKGPKLVFSDGTESIFLADMSGDGLSDLVRVRNGEVCYWPNLGYGKFGAKIGMDGSPWFDAPEQFDGGRVRFADIDGSGTADLIYFGAHGTQIYFNLSGNSWSKRCTINSLPLVDGASAAAALDLLGNGTACLVWSTRLPGSANAPMLYLKLMGDQKPHLLIKTRNNLGAETRIDYAPSTKFYVADLLRGTPWITRINFPVHVVERVRTYDYISRSLFVTRYAYHHGYYDGLEREFRGFGMVEQWDTEDFTAFSPNDDFMNADNIDPASDVPPVYTKTWFHNGAYFEEGRISSHYQKEYYRDGRSDRLANAAAELPDTVLPTVLRLPRGATLPHDFSADEARQACRALKGGALREEIYALDGTEAAGRPYVVTERNYTIEALQPKGPNPYGVYFTHAREVITLHYERNPDDPRVGHDMTLEVDDYGNALKLLAIAYGRTPGKSSLTHNWDKMRQEQLLIRYTENDVSNPIDDVSVWLDDHRTPLPAETRTYEVTGLYVRRGAACFSYDDFTGCNLQRCAELQEIPYEQSADPTKRQKRMFACQRTLYRRDDLSALLAMGEVEPRAMAGEAYELAFTPGLLRQVYRRNGTDLFGGDPSALLASGGGDHGGYVDLDDDQHWWIPSGRVFFSPGRGDDAPAELAYAQRHFFTSCRYRDPFHADQWNTESTVGYDAYDLLPRLTIDAVGNVVSAAYDYRVLQAETLTDPNGNRVQTAFDALGLVVATAVMGKVAPAPVEGDLLEGFDPDPTLATVQQFVASPLREAADLLGQATTRLVYDLHRYRRCGEPPFAATLARETHVADPGGDTTKIQISFSYSDGFGRETQKKSQAEPGDAPRRNANHATASGDIAPGALVLDAAGQPVMAVASPRWVGTGRAVFNNKGKPVKQYEPFFSSTHLYESERELTNAGVSPVLFYDPLGRVVATVHPNNAYNKVVFDAWQESSFDVNDTAAPNGNETGDPRTDPDIAGYVAAYFAAQPPDWQTWYQQRIGGSMGTEEQDAAIKTAMHANTPSVAHADVLGRTFLTIAQNRVKYGDESPAEPPQEEFYATRVLLDIEGNRRAVRDAVVQSGDRLGRIVVSYGYDMLTRRIYQASMEGGESWMLHDAAAKPLVAWNSRLYEVSTRYDRLRRSLRAFVQGGDPAEPDPELYSPAVLFERTIYGDSPETGLTPDEQQVANVRGRLFKHFDNAGVVTTGGYDFKGNLKSSVREVAKDYKQLIDWNRPQAPGESFASSTTYDALNRLVTVTTPDNSVYRPSYNEATLVDKVELNLQGAVSATTFVANIEYNAKGQRTLIRYGNGASTSYVYDPLTFRLTALVTRRGAAAHPEDCPRRLPSDWRGCHAQNLRYTYDPVGNVTHILDDAQQTIFFRNRRVEPSNDYTYDAVYRLIEATGREHLGQTGGSPILSSYNDASRIGLPQPGDGNAMGRYHERYQYDPVGNFLHFIHHGAHPAKPGWTRAYKYQEPSLLEPGKFSNRLSNTTIGGTTESYSAYGDGYDANGNMLRMPQLHAMRWNFRDELCQSQRQAVNTDDAEGNEHQGERTWYVYSASGERVRKVTERQNGTRKTERIYLGGFEVFREYDGRGTNVTLELETLHLMADKQRTALVETKTIDTSTDQSPPQLIRYQFGNHLGSACLELSELGEVISYEEYTPYGSTSYQAVNSRIKAAAKRYRYTGMEREEESGFNYHGSRYYALWVGRWISADRAGLVDGTNLYWFVRANPICHIDPTGNLSQGAAPEAVTKVAQGVWDAVQGFLQDIGVGAPAPVPVSGGIPMAGTLPAAEAGGVGAVGIVGAVATGAVILGTGALTYFQSNAIAQYGNFLGVPEPGLPLLGRAPMPLPAPLPVRAPAPEPDPEPATSSDVQPKPQTKEKDRRRKNLRRVYITYTKTWWDPYGDGTTDLTYSGRATGVVDMNDPVIRGRFYDEERDQYVEINLQKSVGDVLSEGRDRSHHKNKKVNGVIHDVAYLDKFIFGKGRAYNRKEFAYFAIRGREQQMIDYFGGAQSDTKHLKNPIRTGNNIRGVGKDNDAGRKYWEAATFQWDELFPYTGAGSGFVYK